MNTFDYWVNKREELVENKINSTEEYNVLQPNIIENMVIEEDIYELNSIKLILSSIKNSKSNKVNISIEKIMKNYGWNGNAIGKYEQGIKVPLFLCIEKNKKTAKIINLNKDYNLDSYKDNIKLYKLYLFK